MATYYWVGGSGTWDSSTTTNWSLSSGGAGGAGFPSSADTVVFDVNSNVGTGAFTVTIGTGSLANCLDMTFGSGASSLDGAMTLAMGTNTLTVYGNWTNPASNFSYSGTGTIIFASTSTGKTITTNGISILSNVTLNGVGGGWTLGSALTLSTSTTNFTVINGSFSTGNYNFTSPTLLSNNSNTRSISFGSSTVTLSSITTPLDFTASTGLTFSAGTSTVNFSGATSTIHFGSQTFYNISFTASFYSSGFTLDSLSSCNNLSFPNKSSNAYPILFNGNVTISGILTISNTGGTAGVNRATVSPSVAGTTVTLTAASVSLTDVDFQDIVGAGAATWSGTRLGNAGNNSGISFSASKTVYYSAATAGNFNASNWSTSSGGATASTNFPLPQDTAIIDNNSGTGTISLQGYYFYSIISFSSRTNSLTFNISTTPIYFNNSVTLSSAITMSGTVPVNFNNRTSATITSAGVSWTQSLTFTAINSTITLGDNCTSTASVTTLNYGTLNLNGKTFSCTSFYASGGSIASNLTFNSGTLSISGATTTAFNNTAAGFTTTAGTGTGKISMTAATAKTFVGGGTTYNCTLSNDGAGALTITGNNTFTTIANGVQPTTITITSGSTQTVTNFNVSGTTGNLVTLNSSVAGTRGTLSKSSGTVSVSYVSIKDSAATGGAIWKAYTSNGNVNVSNNAGWYFAPVNGNFLAFM